MAKLMATAVLASALFAASAASSADMYVTTVRGGDAGSSTLHRIDAETGEVIATIGAIGYKVNGMAWDETTNTLYATTSGNDGNFPYGLITIDLETGAGTPVGVGAGQDVNLPAIDSTGQLYSWSEYNDTLVAWDKNTGSLTYTSGPEELGTANQTLAFDNNDVLYLVNEDHGGVGGASDVPVYIIDPATGASTAIGAIENLPLDPNEDPNDALAFAHHGDFNPENNYLYAIGGIAPWDDGPRTIQIINMSTYSMVDSFTVALSSLHTLVFVGGITEIMLVERNRTMRPDRYTLAPDLIPSNVPTCSGSKFVNGFQILGGGEISWFVEHSKKDECFDLDVTVLPEGVSAKVVSEVLAALGSSNFDVYRLQ